MKKTPKKRLTVLENKKIMKTIFIVLLGVLVISNSATLLYWAPQINRTSEVINQNNYTSGIVVERTHSYIPSFGKANNVRESIVRYTFEGEKRTANTFVWSARPGRSVLVYVDSADPQKVVTKSQHEQAVLNTSLASFILAVIAGLGVYFLVKHLRHKKS